MVGCLILVIYVLFQDGVSRCFAIWASSFLLLSGYILYARYTWLICLCFACLLRRFGWFILYRDAFVDLSKGAI